MAATVALIGLLCLKLNEDIMPHVCKGLEAIEAYISCCLLARLAVLNM